MKESGAVHVERGEVERRRSRGQGFLVALVTVLFWLNLLRFTPEVLPPVFSVFWLDFVFFAAAVLIVLFGAIKNRPVRLVWMVIFLGVCVLALLPVIGGAVGEKATYSARVIYVSAVLPVVFWVWFRSPVELPSFYARVLVASTIPVGLVVALQLWYVAPISDWVYWLWGTDKLRSLESASPRVYGTFYNANWFGVYSVIVGVAAWFLWRTKQMRGVGFLVALFISLAFILVSGSRTALIGAGVAVVSAVIVLSAQRGLYGSFRAAGGVVGGLAVFLGLFSAVLDDSLLRRWRELFSGEGVSSAEGRFATWSESWSRIVEYPWVGAGVHGTPHNSYLATLEAFGLVVGGALIGFYILIVGVSWALAKKPGASLVVPVLMAFSVMAATAEFFYTTQLMILVVPLVMWSLGSVLRKGQQSVHERKIRHGNGKSYSI